MSKVVAEIAIGVAVIALDVFLPGLGIALTPYLSSLLISVGASLVLAGIGTLLTPNNNGLATATRNPLAAWNVVYGRARVGGTIVYMEETGDTNKYLHQVFVLACHPCQSVDAVLFDSQRLYFDGNGNSYPPAQKSFAIQTISRANDVVTVTFTAPTVNMDGTTVQIENVADRTYNGRYLVTQLTPTTLTYICGGNPGSSSGGDVKTLFANYGTNVRWEVLLGNHTSTFPTLVQESSLWTNQHLLSGRTAVYLRLLYSQNLFANGVPTISFLVHGKNDILDPRTGQNGYTENAALCIADYLAQPVWGFKAIYGTEIPAAQLITAANICDEAVPLVKGGTEPRYTVNGTFPLSLKRGEVLQNLLTACGGRLTYSGGQFVIHPAGWPGSALYVGGEEFLQVTPAGAAPTSFALSAAPVTQTIGLSGTANYAVTITPEGGFDSAVQLAVSGLPSGATASLNPTTISGVPWTSTLAVTLSDAGAGTYPLQISAASGVLTDGIQVSLVVSASGGGYNDPPNTVRLTITNATWPEEHSSPSTASNNPAVKGVGAISLHSVTVAYSDGSTSAATDGSTSQGSDGEESQIALNSGYDFLPNSRSTALTRGATLIGFIVQYHYTLIYPANPPNPAYASTFSWSPYSGSYSADFTLSCNGSSVSGTIHSDPQAFVPQQAFTCNIPLTTDPTSPSSGGSGGAVLTPPPY